MLSLLFTTLTLWQSISPVLSFTMNIRHLAPNASKKISSGIRLKYHDEEEEDGGEPINNDTLVDKNASQLQQRLYLMRAEIYSQQTHLPPNSNLNPIEFITAILGQLHQPTTPQSGYRTLIRSCSDEWKGELRKSIGVPNDMDISEETFVNALGEAIARPRNQYEILVQEEEDGSGSPVYVLYFPGEVVDYQDSDGMCWVETQLRSPIGGTLFAILGWSLVTNDNGAWMVDKLDWQDFRDEFRPGIGREEWMRICG